MPSIGIRQSATIDNAIQVLRTLEANSRMEAQPAGGPQSDQRETYVRWAGRAEQYLGSVLPREGVDKLFDSQRHRDICSMPMGSQITMLISAEVDRICAALSALADDFERARALFSQRGVYVVPDTSFYIEHPDKIRDVDWRPLLTIREEPVHVVVPILVIDELDGLKRSGDRNTRWRAGHTLGVIDEVVANPPLPGVLHLEDFSAIDNQTGGIPSGEVTLQIALDPTGHRRLPINDDEIVDRALACQGFAGHLKMLTYDTGQFTRARAAGLPVTKLPIELGPEPV